MSKSESRKIADQAKPKLFTGDWRGVQVEIHGRHDCALHLHFQASRHWKDGHIVKVRTPASSPPWAERVIEDLKAHGYNVNITDAEYSALSEKLNAAFWTPERRAKRRVRDAASIRRGLARFRSRLLGYIEKNNATDAGVTEDEFVAALCPPEDEVRTLVREALCRTVMET